MPGIQDIKNRIHLFCATLLLPVSVGATTTWSAYWDAVTITAIGPESAGEISVDATKDDRGFLKLRVQSAYGDHIFVGEIEAPHIETITIHQNSDGVDGFEDLFHVCLYFGHGIQVNYGTDENPDTEWHYNKAVYSFTPTETQAAILKTNEPWFYSDCDPSSFK